MRALLMASVSTRGDVVPRKKALDEWIQMFTLPNISIEEPIEIDGVAILSVHDERAQALARRHNRFSMYLNQFTSEFGQQVSPSLILVRADKFGQYSRGFGWLSRRGRNIDNTLRMVSGSPFREQPQHQILELVFILPLGG
jgi:hypothetical protein